MNQFKRIQNYYLNKKKKRPLEIIRYLSHSFLVMPWRLDTLLILALVMTMVLFQTPKIMLSNACMLLVRTMDMDAVRISWWCDSGK